MERKGETECFDRLLLCCCNYWLSYENFSPKLLLSINYQVFLVHSEDVIDYSDNFVRGVKRGVGGHHPEASCPASRSPGRTPFLSK
jgi:hypothetical protein